MDEMRNITLHHLMEKQTNKALVFNEKKILLWESGGDRLKEERIQGEIYRIQQSYRIYYEQQSFRPEGLLFVSVPLPVQQEQSGRICIKKQEVSPPKDRKDSFSKIFL